MPPYAHALREALGLPVFDIYSLITWFHAGLRRATPIPFPRCCSRVLHSARDTSDVPVTVSDREPQRITTSDVPVTG